MTCLRELKEQEQSVTTTMGIWGLTNKVLRKYICSLYKTHFYPELTKREKALSVESWILSK